MRGKCEIKIDDWATSACSKSMYLLLYRYRCFSRHPYKEDYDEFGTNGE